MTAPIVCRCRPGVISGDCPVSYANGAHERGESWGHTPESLSTAVYAASGLEGPARLAVFRRLATVPPQEPASAPGTPGTPGTTEVEP